jgi:hypothetical protein
VRTSSSIKGLTELGLFLELRGLNLALYYFGLEGTDSGPLLCNQNQGIKIWRIAGSNTAPHHFGKHQFRLLIV